MKVPILKPINPEMDDPIWVVCDTSASGVGAFYGQGKTWENCRPAGFMLHKLKEAQQNYRVFEMEMLAILKALTKWEDKLISQKFMVITDHQSLKFFSRQKHLSGRQARWVEYLSRFDFEVVYVKGQYNIVADCLSRYYSSDLPGETHADHNYVSADLRLDPDRDNLPYGLTTQYHMGSRHRCEQCVRATLPPSMLFADRVLLRRGYSISDPSALVETVSKYKGLH